MGVVTDGVHVPPEVLDPRPFAEQLVIAIESAEAEAASALSAVESVARQAAWPDSEVAFLRERTRAAVDRLRAGSQIAVEIGTRHHNSTDTGGAAIVTFIANRDQILGLLLEPARVLDAFVTFAHDVEARLADAHRLEVKIREIEDHQRAHQEESSRLEMEARGAADPRAASGAAARLDHLRGLIEQEQEKLGQRKEQLTQRRVALRNSITVYLRRSDPAAGVGPIEAGLRAALSVERRFDVPEPKPTPAPERRARPRRGTPVLIAFGLCGIAAVVAAVIVARGSREVPPSPDLELMKEMIVQHSFLKTRLLPSEAQEIQSARSRDDIYGAFDRIFARIEAAGEPKLDQFPNGTWGMGLVLIAAGHQRVRLIYNNDDVVAELQARFGGDTRLKVVFTAPAGKTFELPHVATLQEFCDPASRVRFLVGIDLPFGTRINTKVDLGLDVVAASFCGRDRPSPW